MLPRRETRKVQVRARLLEAAIALFRQQGIDRTTVQEIVERADTSKGTFFNYFPTKEHVLVAYYETLTDSALKRAVRGPRPASTAARVSRLLLACASTLDDPALARGLLRAVFSRGVVAAADSITEDRLHSLLRDMLQDGIGRGELRADLEVPVFCALLTSALSSSVQDWALRGDSRNLGAGLRAKIEVLFRAAITPA